MSIEPQDLEQNGYVELDRLAHKELVPFIRTYIKKQTYFSQLYYLANLMCFGLVGYLFVNGVGPARSLMCDQFTHLSYGLVLAFVLLPIHEYIHVLAYRSQGAKNTSYKAQVRKLYFMALADKFVVNKKEFQVVALAPFVLISSALLLSLFIARENWHLTIAGILLTHTAMCSGDFGLLSYFEFYQDKDVVTYDDINSGMSYFFAKERP